VVVATHPAKKRSRRNRKEPRGLIATRYRAYPTPEQSSAIKRIGGCCRWLKNRAKEQRDKAREAGEKSPTYNSQSTWALGLRKDPSRPWLEEAPAQVLQQAVKDVAQAYQNFFSGQAAYPTWCRYSAGYSFRDPQHVGFRLVSNRWAEVKVQGLGWVKVRAHRALKGANIKSATVVMEPDGKVFISLLTSCHRRNPSKPKVPDWSSATGVDRGVAIAFATSDGDLIDRVMRKPKEAEHLKRLERKRERQKLSRQAENKVRKSRGLAELPKKSRSQEKTERRIAAVHARARRRRADMAEQVSTSLARAHRLVVWEDLNVKAMTASAKGTVEKPGKNVAQKSGLDRSILDKGWGMTRQRTDRKVLRHGHHSITVPAPYTSITCPICQNVDKANRVTRSMFVCQSCGYRAHADTNAAVEIRRRGIKLVFAGGTPVTASLSTNQGPKGAEPSGLPWRESRNYETGTSTTKGAA